MTAAAGCRGNGGGEDWDATASASATASQKARHVSQHRFGYYEDRECRGSKATCREAPLIGKCTCGGPHDCVPSEIGDEGVCQLGCSEANALCPRGESATRNESFVSKWKDPRTTRSSCRSGRQRRRGLPDTNPRCCTSPTTSGTIKGHLRVSFRGDGSYVIEVDGISQWNRSLRGKGPFTPKGRELLSSGVVRGRGKTPGI